jgi:hypothetical protein
MATDLLRLQPREVQETSARGCCRWPSKTSPPRWATPRLLRQKTDFTEVGSPTITTLYSSGFTSVGKTSGKAGVDFTAPNTGTVEACAFVESTDSSGTGAIHLALADGSNNNLMLAPAWATGSNQELGRTLCGYLDVTAATGYTVKMRGWTNSGGTLRMGRS